MAIDPTNHYPTMVNLETLITERITSIETRLTDMTVYLSEDVTTQQVSVKPESRSQYFANFKILQEDFKWFKELNGFDKAMSLITAIAVDRANAVKDMYILDTIKVI